MRSREKHSRSEANLGRLVPPEQADARARPGLVRRCLARVFAPATIASALFATNVLGGCYYHARAGAGVATDREAGGSLVSASAGLNGLRGGVGIQAGALFLERQWSGSLGVEAFRLWRSRHPVQPYAGAAVTLFELGTSDGELMYGGGSPRAELGLMWFAFGYSAFSVGVAAEYRIRTDGLSTPLYSLQLGFGNFEFLDASSSARDPASADEPAGTPGRLRRGADE